METQLRLLMALGVGGLVLGSGPAAAQDVANDSTRLHYPIDHVAWILNQETLNVIAESTLLRDEFANSSSRRSPDDDTLEAFYLWGSLTYLEFVARPDPGLEVAPGDAMVAFNAETEGSVDWIIARMREDHPESNPSRSLMTLRGDESIPFAHVATFDYETGHQGFGAWVLEQHREFRYRASGGRAQLGDISRVKSNPAYRHHPDKFFKDVISVTAAVSETRRRNIVNLLAELGYEIEQSDTKTVCTGDENVIELIPRTDQKYAITRIRVSLTRLKEGERVYRFGPDITLTFGDGLEAEWAFGGVR
jgi:hypothetical protein